MFNYCVIVYQTNPKAPNYGFNHSIYVVIKALEENKPLHVAKRTCRWHTTEVEIALTTLPSWVPIL